MPSSSSKGCSLSSWDLLACSLGSWDLLAGAIRLLYAVWYLRALAFTHEPPIVSWRDWNNSASYLVWDKWDKHYLGIP